MNLHALFGTRRKPPPAKVGIVGVPGPGSGDRAPGGYASGGPRPPALRYRVLPKHEGEGQGPRIVKGRYPDNRIPAKTVLHGQPSLVRSMVAAIDRTGFAKLGGAHLRGQLSGLRTGDKGDHFSGAVVSADLGPLQAFAGFPQMGASLGGLRPGFNTALPSTVSQPAANSVLISLLRDLGTPA